MKVAVAGPRTELESLVVVGDRPLKVCLEPGQQPSHPLRPAVYRPLGILLGEALGSGRPAWAGDIAIRMPCCSASRRRAGEAALLKRILLGSTEEMSGSHLRSSARDARSSRLRKPLERRPHPGDALDVAIVCQTSQNTSLAAPFTCARPRQSKNDGE
jgi:hypothetical protein